jgi:hypothetical protein
MSDGAIMRRPFGPVNYLLLSGSTSFRCRIFSAAAVLILISFTTFDQLISFSYVPQEVTQRSHHPLDADTRHDNEEEDVKVCHGIKSLLDISGWPDIVFFEDHPDFAKTVDHDPNREENVLARATVAEFNRIRNSVLTTTLLDEGINVGSLYAAQSFAQRFLARGNDSRPLSIAVTGNSFTIGSNCGENTIQQGCAWPDRLAQRWKELVGGSFGSTPTNSEIEWRMLQANAQASNNVMHRLPSLIEEYHSNNKTMDVLLLNNGISDLHRGAIWFEAVVRVVLEHFPQIVIISLVDGIPEFVGNGDEYAQGFLGSYINVQDHYNITRIDIAKMSRLLRDSDQKIYSALRQQYPESSLLWPQVDKLMYANGTTLTEEYSGVRPGGLPIYWANYTPRVEKTRIAYYPTNHPTWTTHQYVADSVLYTILRVLTTGMRCNVSMTQREVAAKPPLPVTTVADKAEVERCFACLKSKDQLDARVLKVVANGTNNSDELSVSESPVVVTCGDWKWVTDERKRSGWQSDQAGSLIRFRLKVSEVPTFSLTYMTSHASFGSFLVSFQPISKTNSSQPLMGCNDVAKFENQTHLPSMRIEGRRAQFSLWDTFIFSGKLDSNDYSANELMKKTVLDKMGESKDIENIDMYVLNSNYYGHEKRVKIQTVTSC